MGQMNDDNVAAACQGCGLAIPCAGPQNCQYNDNICVQTNNEPACNLPMDGLAESLCGNVYPSACPQLYDVYQYMGHNWNNNSACGAIMGQWCTTGNNYMDQWALCIAP